MKEEPIETSELTIEKIIALRKEIISTNGLNKLESNFTLSASETC
jgi:hypothetical protein